MGSVLRCCQIEEARFVPEEEIVCINSSDLLFPPVDLSPWRPEHTKGHRETEKPARNAKKRKQIKKRRQNFRGLDRQFGKGLLM